VTAAAAERAIVTAGWANEVEPVNQYAEVIYSPTVGFLWISTRGAAGA
jgi:hypothetical protein